MFKWIFFVIQKLMSTFMIFFYVKNSFQLHIVCLETAEINNQTILQFVNLWSK